ncbi:MAG: hypothetical protein WCP60_02540 [bacterium]
MSTLVEKKAPHFDARAIVDAFQFFEQQGKVCPANWNTGKEGMTANFDSVADYLSAS